MKRTDFLRSAISTLGAAVIPRPNPTYAEAIRQLLRVEPQIFFIGEVRSSEDILSRNLSIMTHRPGTITALSRMFPYPAGRP